MSCEASCSARVRPKMTTSLATRRGIKPNKTENGNEKPSSEVDHHPFITKVQVRIKSTTNGLDATADNLDNTKHYLKSTNISVSETPTHSVASGNVNYNENYQLYKEKKEEKKRQRRAMLGELACAPYIERETQEKDELLYQPCFGLKECSVQLLLVKELTNHLHCVSMNTSTAKRKNIPKSVAFHARETKGERKLGVRR